MIFLPYLAVIGGAVLYKTIGECYRSSQKGGYKEYKYLKPDEMHELNVWWVTVLSKVDYLGLIDYLEKCVYRLVDVKERITYLEENNKCITLRSITKNLEENT